MKGGWVKVEIVHKDEAVLKESPPLPPPKKILIIHLKNLSMNDMASSKCMEMDTLIDC